MNNHPLSHEFNPATVVNNTKKKVFPYSNYSKNNKIKYFEVGTSSNTRRDLVSEITVVPFIPKVHHPKMTDDIKQNLNLTKILAKKAGSTASKIKIAYELLDWFQLVEETTVEKSSASQIIEICHYFLRNNLHIQFEQDFQELLMALLQKNGGRDSIDATLIFIRFATRLNNSDALTLVVDHVNLIKQLGQLNNCTNLHESEVQYSIFEWATRNVSDALAFIAILQKLEYPLSETVLIATLLRLFEDNNPDLKLISTFLTKHLQSKSTANLIELANSDIFVSVLHRLINNVGQLRLIWNTFFKH